MEYVNTNVEESFEFEGTTGHSITPKKRTPDPAGSNAVLSSDNEVLNLLPVAIFESLKPYLRRVYVQKEQFLYHQDDDLEYVYFPETAVISEFHILDDGRMVEVCITGREGAVGISSLYHANHIANCVQVSQAGNLLKIESSLLRKVGAIYPKLPLYLHTTLENYIGQLSKRAVCNVYHSVEGRFCTWLLMMHDRCGQKKLKLTHEQIARALGVYRPSVTCIALSMRKKRLIDYSRGGISILDRTRLEDFACGCYGELNHRPSVSYSLTA